jgi:SAM-dependent methyltransferase
MHIRTEPLYLPEADFARLFADLGPSLGFWRAAEIAALREQPLEPPLLDLGCGDGYLTRMVVPRAEWGLDPDGAALSQAARLGLYERTLSSPIEDCDLPDGSVATVISNSVLEHIPRLDDALQAVGRLLRPGGRLIFTSPTEAFSRWLALPLPGYAQRRNRQYAHHNLLSLAEWSRRLGAAGLEVEQARPYLRPAWVTAWDWLELAQRVRVGRRGLFSRVWKRLPSPWVTASARKAARINLAAPEPGGGRLIVARKP